MEEWPKPFWSGGPSTVLKWYSCGQPDLAVQFQTAIIMPAGVRQSACQRLPLLFYFAGLGSFGGLGDFKIADLSEIAPVPFIVVAPLRPKGTWWTLSDDREWGFLDGSFLPGAVDKYVEWMRHMSREPEVDPSRLVAFGFSAGAYAVTELLAHASSPLSTVLLGGVHGHGQPDLEGVVGKRAKWGDQILAKWQAYVGRLRMHAGACKGIIGVHDRGDQICPWRYAEVIYNLLNARQQQLRFRPVELKEVNGKPMKKNKSLHNYYNEALHDPEILRHLFLGEACASTYELSAPVAPKRRWKHSKPDPLLHSKMDSSPPPPCLVQGTCSDHARGQSPQRSLQRAGSTAASLSPVPQPDPCGALPASPPAQKKREPPSPRQALEPVSKRWMARSRRPPTPPPPPRRDGSCEASCSQEPPDSPTPRSAPAAARSPSALAAALPERSRSADDQSAPEASLVEANPVDRSSTCANPSCFFRVHSDPAFGGFCCKKCHWRFASGSKCKKKHGDMCQQRTAANANRAPPVPPEQPVAWH
mmetsp:Transcript_18380/g.55919  ORF Transcript_18380/g.55919 Transcript_18380/m.55919 type:complete len:531 (-) Transcript_18380:216-1808(-)